MKYTTNQFKPGLKVLIEKEPCSILSYEFHKPGKGQAVMRTKLYNLRTQKVWERTFKSGESVEAADVVSNSVTTVQEVLGDMMGDAPACYDCGHITIRNGSCYKCLNCGNSLGCS